MASDTVTKPGVVDAAKRELESKAVLILASKPGVVPMERRLADGSKNLSSCDYNAQGKMINVKSVRPLRFGVDCTERIDPQNADDLAHLEEVRAWIASGDPRVKLLGVEIKEGGSHVPVPFGTYENMKPEAIIARLAEDTGYLADDPEAVRLYLEKVARYELQRTNGRGKATRQKILDAIDDLGVAQGVEYGLDAVDED